MGGPVAHRRLAAYATRISRATALACLIAAGITPPAAMAQDISGVAAGVPEGAQMLLESDTLIYDNDAQTVTAAGGVRIDYGGNRLVAQRVTYDRKTSRLIASGDVQLIDSDGTKVFADTVDIRRFRQRLRQRPARRDHRQDLFRRRERRAPERRADDVQQRRLHRLRTLRGKARQAPIWRIKARKIIWDGKSKVVRFERSRFEFFGLPIAGLPYFEMADPTVKRKSGFLLPGISVNDDRGVGITVPYYLALSPTYDLTLRPTYYTKQGFLGEAEWRQKFNNGEYSLKIAGMRQQDPDEFIDSAGRNVNSGTAIDPNRFRGMIGTKGRFDLNDRWKFGWDVLAQTDKNFSYSYGINGYQQYYRQNEIYLTGLNDRNYFDLRAMKFSVQENLLDSNAAATNDKQPWVLPTLDYSYTPDEPVFGGELNLDMNLRSIHRSQLDNQAYITDGFNSQRGTVRGIEGSSTRLTGEAEWKRSFITDGGLVVTPLSPSRRMRSA